MPAVEPRYAEALLLAAENPDAACKYGETLDFVSKMLSGSQELSSFIFNPVVPRQAKKDTLTRLLPEDTARVASNFLKLLIDKERISKLDGIKKEYEDKRAKLAGVLTVTATSAKALDKAQIDEIITAYKKKYGAMDARLVNIVDASLIGGIKIQVGDILTDDTLAGRLKKLSALLGGAGEGSNANAAHN